MAAAAGVFVVLAILIIIFLASSVKIVLEYERAVIFRLGRCVGAKGPGVFFIVPVLDRIRRVNLQIAAVPVASQAVITKDNVTVTVDAVAYFQVVDPVASIVRIQNWYNSAQLVAQTTLRSMLGRHELDQILSERDRIDAELQIALDTQTEAWGIKVHRVEIRDVGLPDQMQRAMARQAEAERERRAKIIAAEGELQAAEKLGQAADVIAHSPGALQLRQMQTMVEISSENHSTIIFPIPIEILEAFQAVGRMIPAAAGASPALSAGESDEPPSAEATPAPDPEPVPPADPIIPPPPSGPPASTEGPPPT